MSPRYLASGDSWATPISRRYLPTPSALYRISKSTMSYFFPEVCDAVYSSLESYIKVSIEE